MADTEETCMSDGNGNDGWETWGSEVATGLHERYVDAGGDADGRQASGDTIVGSGPQIFHADVHWICQIQQQTRHTTTCVEPTVYVRLRPDLFEASCTT